MIVAWKQHPKLKRLGEILLNKLELEYGHNVHMHQIGHGPIAYMEYTGMSEEQREKEWGMPSKEQVLDASSLRRRPRP